MASRVLVVHNLESRSRQTSIDFTKSFGLHGIGLEVHYINIFGVAAAGELYATYDLVIFTAEVLSLRRNAYWPELKQRMLRLSKQAKRKVMLPQDDYTFSTRLDELVIEAQVDAVWSPLASDPALYPRAVIEGVGFKQCLTGYVEDHWRTRSPFSKSFDDRRIDLGQRVSALPASFGEIGQRKSKITARMSHEFIARGMKVDVSFDSADVLVGDEWLRFLGDTRFTISRKGGSSLADTLFYMTGSLQRLRELLPWLPESYLSRLASKHGVLHGEWEAESPRLFEAAAMGVCQILEQGNYMGGTLKPWVHYIPMASDFGNMEDIFTFISQSDLVQRMIDAARELLVESEKYSYRNFVKDFFKQELQIDVCNQEESGTVLDLDTMPGLLSKSDLDKVGRHFEQLSPLNLLFAGPHERSLSETYEGLMRYELLPESLTTDWVNIGFHES